MSRIAGSANEKEHEMKHASRFAVIVMASAAISMTGSPARAAEPDAFGQHVRDCAQVGLSGEHNPGMHEGAAGWTGMTCHD